MAGFIALFLFWMCVFLLQATGVKKLGFHTGPLRPGQIYSGGRCHEANTHFMSLLSCIHGS